jgi:hypothetical protein
VTRGVLPTLDEFGGRRLRGESAGVNLAARGSRKVSRRTCSGPLRSDL